MFDDGSLKKTNSLDKGVRTANSELVMAEDGLDNGYWQPVENGLSWAHCGTQAQRTLPIGNMSDVHTAQDAVKCFDIHPKPSCMLECDDSDGELTCKECRMICGPPKLSNQF